MPTHVESADQIRITGTLAMSTSYVTGGDTINATALGIGHIDDVIMGDTSNFGVSLSYIGSSKIKMYAIPAIITTGAAIPTTLEMATGTDAHLVIARFWAWGT